MQKPKLIWLNVSIFALSALITLIGVPLYAFIYGFDVWQIALMFVAIVFCEISITAGYHRLWSHKAYKAHWLVRFILAIGGAFATQNSILHWASDHRRHHRFVDNNEKDPYSAKKGFWFSHMGWMIREYQDNANDDYDNCNDLKKDKIVMWQHKHYMAIVLSVNFGIPIVLGLIHGDLWGMILLVGVARLAISHHMTFLINSLAHIWGKQPYSDKNTSRDNGFLAVLTMGEGYHNYHHCFQRDYRNGIYWWQFDPTKWLIRGLSLVGLTSDLYRVPVERIEAAKAQMTLTKTLSKLSLLPNSDELVDKIHAEYDILINKINEFSLAKAQWIKANTDSVLENYDVEHLRQKVDTLKQSFIEQKQQWLLLNASIA